MKNLLLLLSLLLALYGNPVSDGRMDIGVHEKILQK